VEHRVDRPANDGSAVPCAETLSIAASGNGAIPSALTTLLDDSGPIREPAEAAGCPESGAAVDDRAAVADRTADSALNAASMVRTGTFAALLFQIAYMVLGATAYPATFAQALPFHVFSILLVALAMLMTLSVRIIRHWRAMMLGFASIIIVVTAWIGAIDRSDDLLVITISLFFLGSGVLAPWSPRWQLALTALGLLILADASLHSADTASQMAITWLSVLSAALMALMGAIHNSAYRARLDKLLNALAEDHRVLRREMELRAEIAAARERDQLKFQESSTMLRKVFEASPENIAVNSLYDGRFIAVNDRYLVAGYSARDAMESTGVIALQLWPDEREMDRFLTALRAHSRVKDMEIKQRSRSGEIETHLISASIVDVKGEPCVVSMTRDITAIKATETQLRSSQAALRKIFDATLDVIVVSRVSDGSYIDFNRQFEQLGFTRKDLDDSRSGLRQIWADEAQHRAMQDLVARDGQVRNLEVDFISPRGGTISTLLSAVAVELNGEDCVVTMLRDVSAAKDAARKLEESAQTLKAIFDASPDAISVTRILDGKYVAVNDEFLRVGGYAGEQVIGSSDLELGAWTQPSDRDKFSATLTDAGQVRNMEVEFRSRLNPRTPTLISAALISLEREPCVVSYVRDITELKQTENELRAAREELSHQIAALRASETMFRKLFDANLDSMSLTGSDGRLLDVNQEYVRLTGFTREESIGRHFADFNLWIDPKQMVAFSSALFTNNEVRNLEVSFRLKDGTVLEALVSAVNLELNGQLCCLTMTRGIADLKRTQRELVAASEAALAASRAKSEFLSSMSHEIRTPMNAILGMSELIAETVLTDEQRGYMKTVISNGNSLLELINSILDLAKVESGRISLESVDFSPKEVVERVVETLTVRAREKGLALTVQFARGIPDQVAGDPLRLGQILINLVGNAIKFTAHGHVTVSVESERAPDAAIKLKFTVADTGIGISADKLGTLFKPFTQADSSTSRKYGGSGLGLAIVARLVALMSGEVTVESRERIGSAFSFTAQFSASARAIAPAPIVQPAAPGSVEAGAPAPSAVVARPLKILVADDSEDNRALIEAYLKKTPYQVECAQDGQEAVDKFIAGSFDLVFMDIQMPNVDGLQATRQIRDWERDDRRRGHTPIVALTASALDGAAQRTKAAGCDAHITKPVKKTTLLNAIRDAVKQKFDGNPSELPEDLTEAPCLTD
jgi:PAS domain S-box-containing protein